MATRVYTYACIYVHAEGETAFVMTCQLGEQVLVNKASVVDNISWGVRGGELYSGKQ